MTSLDAARAHAQLQGTFQEPLEAAALARQQLRRLPGISLLHDSVTPGRSFSTPDNWDRIAGYIRLGLKTMPSTAQISPCTPNSQSGFLHVMSLLVCASTVPAWTEAGSPVSKVSGCAGEEGVHALDPLRLIVLVDALGMSGFQVDDLLQLEYGVCAEMSTDKVYLLLMRSGLTTLRLGCPA